MNVIVHAKLAKLNSFICLTPSTQREGEIARSRLYTFQSARFLTNIENRFATK